MSDIVERLRGLQKVSQFNSAGVIQTYEATPTPLDLEAADEITRLRAALQLAMNTLEMARERLELSAYIGAAADCGEAIDVATRAFAPPEVKP